MCANVSTFEISVSGAVVVDASGDAGADDVSADVVDRHRSVCRSGRPNEISLRDNIVV
jgi:hypothetical protein